MFRYGLTGITAMLVGFTLLQSAYAGPKFSDYPARKASDCAVKTGNARTARCSIFTKRGKRKPFEVA